MSEYVPPGLARKLKKLREAGVPTREQMSAKIAEEKAKRRAAGGWRPEWVRKEDRETTDEYMSRKRQIRMVHAEADRLLREERSKQAAEEKARREADEAAARRDERERAWAAIRGSYIDFLAEIEVELSPAQHALCAVCFDRVSIAGLDPDIARCVFGEAATIGDKMHRWLTWVIGGRSGKSYLGSMALLWRSIVSDLSCLARGEAATALIVCPDLRLSRHTLGFVRGALRHPAIAACIEIVSDASDSIVIERPDGYQVAIEALPATRGGGAVRARTLVAAMLDEVAFFRDDAYAVNDRDIYQAVSPRVTVPGGFTLISSTPWIESGLLYDEWRENFGHAFTGIAAQVTTGAMRSNSPIILDEIEHARLKDPKNAAREFDAMFGATGSGLFFPPEQVATCTVEESVIARPPAARVLIVADASFSQDSSDRFGWCVVTSQVSPLIDSATGDRRERRVTTVLECDAWAVDRDPRAMAARLRDEVCLRYDQRNIIIDQYSDRAFQQLCADVGLHAEIIHWLGGEMEDSKAERYRRVRTAMATAQLVLPANASLRGDLATCRSKLLPGGGERIEVQRTRRGHGDVLAAVILGVSEAILNPSRFSPAEQTADERYAEQRRRELEAAKKRAAQKHRWR